jgi:hypothetical protein
MCASFAQRRVRRLLSLQAFKVAEFAIAKNTRKRYLAGLQIRRGLITWP